MIWMAINKEEDYLYLFFGNNDDAPYTFMIKDYDHLPVIERDCCVEYTTDEEDEDGDMIVREEYVDIIPTNIDMDSITFYNEHEKKRFEKCYVQYLTKYRKVLQ